MEFARGVGNEESRRIPVGANSEVARHTLGDPLPTGHGYVELHEQFLHLVLEEAPCLRQLHLRRRALKQPETKLLFQVVDLPTQRGLRHPESFGGAAEIQLIGHCQKVAQVAQFHR